MRLLSSVTGIFLRYVLGALLVCVLSAQVASPQGQQTALLAGSVVRVIDGDTIDVLLASGIIRVRLHGIDAPEREQAGGSAARTWLAQQLRDQQVLLEPVSQDRYERMVAVVHLRKRQINRELVQNGYAWAYRRYMRRSDGELCAVEARARQRHAGLWAALPVNAPWEHRSTAGKGPFTSYDRSSAADCRMAIGH